MILHDAATMRAGRRYVMTEDEGIEYALDMVDDVLSPGNPALARYCMDRSVLAVVSPTIERLHGARIRAYFDGRPGRGSWSAYTVPTGERNKTMETATGICAAAERVQLGRDGVIVAVGGGIVGDLAGVAASLYRRGIRHIRVNTTLLAQVDAGVGIKSAVNFGGAKNLLGSYHPPSAAINDLGFLRTLPLRELRCGLGEVIKMAVVRDADLFRLIEEQHPLILGEAGGCATARHDVLDELVGSAAYDMLDELAGNLFEHELARRVDFGHTFSPAIETGTGHRLRHGEAVAIDIAISTRIAFRLGWISERDAGRIVDLLRAVGLPVFDDEGCTHARMVSALDAVVLHRGGRLNLVLPTGIGSVAFLHDRDDAGDAIIAAALADLGGMTDALGA